MPKNEVVFGWGAPPMSEQHPVLSANDAEHFDKDNVAMTRLKIRGVLSDSEHRAAARRLAKKIEKAVRAALADQSIPKETT